MEVDLFSWKFFAFGGKKRHKSSLWDIAFIPLVGCVFHQLMAIFGAAFSLLKFYYYYSLGRNSVSLGLEEGDFTGEMPNSK